MNHGLSFRVLSCLSLLAFCACGASARPSAPAGDSCEGRTQRARGDVEAAVEAARTCASDQDCVTVEVATGCFDACTRAVAASGLDAVKAAMASADETTCKAFTESGCARIVPPCAPPTQPACHAGKCE